MLLSRARLFEIRDLLRARVTVRPATDLEHRLLFLADQASRMMSVPPVPSAPLTTDLADQISKFAVLGSVGPDLVAFSSMLAPGQAWVFDTMHKGNPDRNRERVVAGTTDFPLKLWQSFGRTVEAGQATSQDRAYAKSAMRAYVLGHLCHVAGDLICHPYISELEWRLAPGTTRKFTFEGGEGVIDARVAQDVLLSPGTREGQSWSTWWPTIDEIPRDFFTAYAATLSEVYSAEGKGGATFKEFQQAFPVLPDMSEEFVRDGYRFYTHGVLQVYDFGYWNWWAFLLPLEITLLALFPLAGLALPRGSRLFRSAPWDAPDAERGMFELLTLPLTMASLPTLVYAIWAAALSGRGAGMLTGLGIGGAVVSLAAFITFIATLQTEVHWLVRWGILFGVPLAISVYFLVRWLTESDRRRAALALLYAMPLLVTLAFLPLYALVSLPLLGLAGLAGDTAREVAFWVMIVLLSLLLGALWFVAARSLRDAIVPEVPDLSLADKRRLLLSGRLPREPRHFVRVFDDATLYHDSQPPPITLDKQRFPSGRRKLLKLWWEGAGDLWIRPERYQLVFSFTGNESDPKQVVAALITPLTGAEYGQYLNLTVKEPGGATGKLHAQLVVAGDIDYELPAGATFADHGDDKPSVREHDDAARQFKKLGRDGTAADAYMLYHALKAHQSVRYGQAGPVPRDQREDGSVPGAGTLASHDTTVTGDAHTTFLTFFTPRDILRVGDELRTVTLVTSDNALTIDSSFSPDLPPATQYERGDSAARAQGEGSISSHGTRVTGVATSLQTFFAPGDILNAAGQLRDVTEVKVDSLIVSAPFTPDLPAGTAYERVGTLRERREGYLFVTDPGGPPTGGETLMDRAADLGAVLCMGAVPHLLDPAERTVAALSHARTAGGPSSAALKKVYQVFRNWNLDRRRENEWRMLVEGGAFSDKGTDPSRYDEALLQPRDGEGGAPLGIGEATANRLGWIPLLRKWLAMLRSAPRQSAAASTGD